MLLELVAAVALVMVIEGLLPFLSPARFRRAMLRAASLSDRTLRSIGLVSMVLGLILLQVVK